VSRSPGPDHERWADSVGAYLLEALPDDERHGFERHLDACATCTDEVRSLRVALHALPGSVEQLAPPPALRDRIMAAVDAEAELLAAAAGPRADLPAPRRARRRRRRFGLPALRPAFALACAAALLVLGGLGGVLVSGGGGGGGERGSDVRTVVASVERGDATAKLLVGRDASHLEVSNLGKPPEGRVYQVWTRREGSGRPRPTTALFVPRKDGTASVAVPGSLKGVAEVLVTDEPVGGSDKPTRTPFLFANPARAKGAA